MAAKRTTSTPDTETESEGFGDEHTDLSRFAEDNAPVKTKAAFTQAQLMELAESDDPLALLAQYAAEAGIETIASVTDVLSDGTTIMEKAMLVNREFYVIDWRFHDSSKFGGTFCAIKCMDMSKRAGEAGRMFVFTDGGSGIHDRLAMFQLKNENQTVPMHVPYGLSPSTYETTDSSGDEITATTWYFANSVVKP